MSYRSLGFGWLSSGDIQAVSQIKCQEAKEVKGSADIKEDVVETNEKKHLKMCKNTLTLYRLR